MSRRLRLTAEESRGNVYDVYYDRPGLSPLETAACLLVIRRFDAIRLRLRLFPTLGPAGAECPPLNLFYFFLIFDLNL